MDAEISFKWSDSYRTGHEVIDKEHQYLFSLLQDVKTAADNCEDNRTTVTDALNKLIEYTQQHFAHEEELMLHYDYTGYEEHKQKHLALVNQVEDFVEDLLDGEPILIFELMIFLKDWLTEHILEDDMILVGVFNQTG